ncbi:hypothetical protein BGZ92_007919 [Podila epicladia]|nr:hypothetical protein BGZ92_007919 [Podila epicladia]
MSSLDLNTLTFTETNLSTHIFNHAATTERFDSSDNRIGIVFGQTSQTPSIAAPPLQWLNTNTGVLQTPSNLTSTGGGGGGGKQPAPVVPTGRTGHTLVQISNTFWAFGGRGIGTGTGATLPTMPDSPSYNAKENTWTSKAKGMPRYGHASVKLDGDKVLSCYGASTTGANLDSDCVVFSITTSSVQSANMKWENPDDAINGGRLGATLVPGTQNYITYMFGGRSTDGAFFNDVYKLDATKLPDILISKLVQPDLPASYIPTARSGHVAVPVFVGEETSKHGFMVIYGGYGADGMATGSPYFFSTTTKYWVGGDQFRSVFLSATPTEQVSVTVIIVCILAGVSVLGACVAFYIWKGISDDRRKKEADDAAILSPTYSNDSPRGDGSRGAFERKNHVYPSLAMNDLEDHSMPGPFKSTSSLIQPEETKSKKKVSKPWVNEPNSPSGTTLTEGGSTNGYASSSGGRANNFNSSNGNLANQRNSGPGGSGSSIQSGGRGGRESYYNPRDLYLDTEDDDSSITVSLASESTLSPWAGPVRLSSDLAPPNPRFSRGAISQAHRQLVRGSGGWGDTSSPGGSLSSREDEHHRRSVNSMQWVSFEAYDPSSRPDSMLFDPLAARSNLTVRNASFYGGNGNASRLSMYGGSASGGNTSDGTDDSNYNQGGKRISAALAARQQRRSFRNSQESFKGNNGGSSNSDAGDAFVTKVLPIITNKVTKPSMAKVVNQRGSRIVVPSSGPLGRRDDEEFEGQQNPGSVGSLPNFGSDNYGSSSSRGYPQGRRTSSTLNPGYKTQTQQKRESRLANSTTASGTVILRMPPPPKNPSGLRDSIAELGDNMPGFLQYGEGHS